MKLFPLILLLAAQLLTPQEKHLLIVSRPESSLVYINGLFKGITPLNAAIIDSLPGQDITVRIEKPAHIPLVVKCSFDEIQDTISVVLRQGAVLNIVTIPESASVFIDGALYGRTPFFVDTLEPRPVSVTLVKQQYYPYKMDITAIAGQTIRFSPLLQRFSNYIALTATSPTDEISLDGKRIGTGSVDSVDVRFGNHTLSVFDPVTNAAVQNSFVLNSTGMRTFHAKMRHYSYSKMSYGLVLPGLNQFEDGSIVEGGVLMGAAIYGVYNFVKNRTAYQSALSTFNNAKHIYDKSIEEQQAATTREKVVLAYDEMKQSAKKVNSAAIIPAVIWLVNAVSVITSHSITDSIIEVSDHQSVGIFPQRDFTFFSLNYTVTF